MYSASKEVSVWSTSYKPSNTYMYLYLYMFMFMCTQIHAVSQSYYQPHYTLILYTISFIHSACDVILLQPKTCTGVTNYTTSVCTRACATCSPATEYYNTSDHITLLYLQTTLLLYTQPSVYVQQ